MSYDIEVYGTHAVTPEQLAAVVADAGGQAEGSPPFVVVHRMVRGRRLRAFAIDGPLRVEREDLPGEVAAAMVGVRVLYEITVEDRARPPLALAMKIARTLAELTDGVVHDRQNDDRPIWSRRPLRLFKPPAAKRIDVIDFEWFIRREDLPPGLPGRLLESFRTWIPEALPRRFGEHEPLQHALADEGDDGFVRAWRSESGGLFWKTTRPCLSGSASAIGDAFTPYLIGGEDELRHPIGQISLTLDLRTLEDRRWRDDLVSAFASVAEVTGAFYAQASVERNWGYGGGSLWCDGQTQTNPGLTVRARWYGLPPYPVWLAWHGDLYHDHLKRYLDGDCRKLGGGLLWQASDHPHETGSIPWPAEVTMTLIPEDDPRFPDQNRQPAQVIPEGFRSAARQTAAGTPRHEGG